MKGSRWLWVGAALAAAGCGEVVGEGYDYGTLAVRVTVGDTMPAAGAPVELYNWQRTLATGVTDAEGRYEFGFVPFGEVGVRTFPLPAHASPARDGIVVGQGERVEVELTMFRPCCGTIRLRTVDDLGAPVAGTRLVLYAATLPSVEAETGADGGYLFTGLHEEQYGVQVNPPAGYTIPAGRENFVDGLAVEPSSDTTVVVTLARTALAP